MPSKRSKLLFLALSDFSGHKHSLSIYVNVSPYVGLLTVLKGVLELPVDVGGLVWWILVWRYHF